VQIHDGEGGKGELRAAQNEKVSNERHILVPPTKRGAAVLWRTAAKWAARYRAERKRA